jgi:hypothetical protein
LIVIIPSSILVTTLDVSVDFTSKTYLPGLILAVFAAVIDIVTSPFDALVIVQVILAVILAE